MLAGHGCGDGVKGRVGLWGGDSAVQPHSMGGVRRDTHTGTHTQRNVHTNVSPTL